jgi:hypothetical protein
VRAPAHGDRIDSTMRQEGTPMTTTTPMDTAPDRAGPLVDYVSIVARPASYRRIAYLLLGLPLGTLWFTGLATAITTSISLLVVALVGIPMLWATGHAVRVFANVERRAAQALLDRDLPAVPVVDSHGNVWQRLRAMSGDRDRWRELGYLLLRFPAGIATFTVAAAALTTPFALALAPIQARISDHPFGDWALSSRMETAATSPWSWLLVPAGAATLVAAFHLLHRLAEACGAWTTAWLTPTP